MSNYVDWAMQGVELTNCNCSWGCPCQFNGTPTQGHCRGLIFVQIDKGHFGDVRLDGVRWGALVAWPGAIHLGKGKFQTIVDDKADAKQRAAIETVSHGGETEPGSLIWQVFSTTVEEFLPTVSKPIQLTIDYTGRSAQLKVPGLIDANAESIRNPVTGAEHPVRVTMPTGFEFTESEVLSGKAKGTGAIELNLDGSHAHLALFHWNNQGVVR